MPNLRKLVEYLAWEGYDPETIAKHLAYHNMPTPIEKIEEILEEMDN